MLRGGMEGGCMSRKLLTNLFGYFGYDILYMKKGTFLLAGMLAVSLIGSGCSSKGQKKTPAGDGMQALFACMDTATVERGGMKLTWIKDNAKEHKMPLALFGELPQRLVDSLNIADGVPSSMSAFLLEAGGKRILFDTGMGAPDSRLMAELEAAGISSVAIDCIYLTHFHGDHIGGLLKDGVAAFPRAEVYAARQEYDGWMQMPGEKKAQVVQTMEVYKNRLHLFEYGDTLPAGVVAMNAEGHTPGHTVYRAGDFLIIGDLVHGAVLQLADPAVCASFDMHRDAAIRSRLHFLDYARKNGLLMAGMHQPAISN